MADKKKRGDHMVKLESYVRYADNEDLRSAALTAIAFELERIADNMSDAFVVIGHRTICSNSIVNKGE